MLLIDGKFYDFRPLPTIFFGHHKPMAYVVNPTAASTLTLNFIFYVNHGYRYFDPLQIFYSPVALLRLRGPELNPEALNLYLKLKPETFSIVRDPLRRFVSAFLSKVFIGADPVYHKLRDELTSLHGIDLSSEADPAESCLAFAKWVAAQNRPENLDFHLRPQHLNLATDSRFTVDTVLRLEDQEKLQTYYAKWVSEEKAKWFLSLRFNERTEFKADDLITDELTALMRKIYAKDYELFYS